jgi:hypothetical protein
VRQLGSRRRLGRGRRAVALVLVVRVRVGIRRRIRMQAVGRRMGSRIRVWIWPLASRVRIRIVDDGAYYSSKSLRETTALDDFCRATDRTVRHCLQALRSFNWA